MLDQCYYFYKNKSLILEAHRVNAGKKSFYFQNKMAPLLYLQMEFK